MRNIHGDMDKFNALISYNSLMENKQSGQGDNNPSFILAVPLFFFFFGYSSFFLVFPLSRLLCLFLFYSPSFFFPSFFFVTPFFCILLFLVNLSTSFLMS